MGQKGVTTALEIIRNEMDISMAFCGERDINKMNRDHLYLK
jgi:L-lactate dehydrogenase (cytochrome)